MKRETAQGKQTRKNQEKAVVGRRRRDSVLAVEDRQSTTGRLMTTAFELEHCKRISRSRMYGAGIQELRRFSIPLRMNGSNGTVALSLVKMIRPPTTTIFTLRLLQFRLQAMSFLRMPLHHHLLYLRRTRNQALWTLTLISYLTLQFQLPVSFLRMRSHQPLLCLYSTRS
jgi:hypothetical protein